MPRSLARPIAFALLALISACGDSGTEPGPAPPSIDVSTSQVSLNADAADAPVTTTISVTNGGEGTLGDLAVSVAYPPGQEEDDWLTATLDGSTAPATLTLEATPTVLSGSYQATVSISSPDADGSPEEISVTLEVAAKPFLYLIRQSDDVLRRMDPETLEIEDVGPLGAPFSYGDCTWDPDARTLWVADARPNQRLYRVDIATGTAEAVGDHGYEDVLALEYHPPSQTLFGVSDQAGRILLRFDTESGEAEEVGDIGQRTDGLVWDSTREEMIGQTTNVGPSGGSLFTIDLETAARTDLGGTPSINNHGLTYDPGRDLIWGADVDGDIYQFDPDSDYDRQTVAENTGEHACIAYVP